jgi:hypothetical protein
VGQTSSVSFYDLVLGHFSIEYVDLNCVAHTGTVLSVSGLSVCVYSVCVVCVWVRGLCVCVFGLCVYVCLGCLCVVARATVIECNTSADIHSPISPDSSSLVIN